MRCKYVCLLFAVVLMLLTVCPASAAEVYYISSEDELFSLVDDPTAEYHLTKNIIVTKPHAPMFDNKNKFYGTLNGNGYTVSYLNIEHNGVFTAFIGCSYGKIQNINFTFAKVMGTSENSLVGGIVALNYGVIENCSFSGEIYHLGQPVYDKGICASNCGNDISGCTDEFVTESSSLPSVSSTSASLESLGSYSEKTNISSDTVASHESDIGHISSVSSKEKPSSSAKNNTSSKASKTSSKASSKTSSTVDKEKFFNTASEIGEEELNKRTVGGMLAGISISAIVFVICYILYKQYEFYRNKKEKESESKK